MIDIVYPTRMHMPVAMVEDWFAQAVALNLVPPSRLSAKTPQEMAEALDDIGWIRLASKQPL